MKHLTCLTLCLALPLCGATAQEDLVRLPGQGEVKSEAAHIEGIGRLIPGGGMLMSFDADRDGNITPTELNEGIKAAFTKADANADGRMTPLEQIKWTKTLPTRDISLNNPARFDPNLDRRVRYEEFTEIILGFAALHADPETGIVRVLALKSEQQGRAPQEEPEFAPKRATAPQPATSDAQTATDASRTSGRSRTGRGS